MIYLKEGGEVASIARMSYWDVFDSLHKVGIGSGRRGGNAIEVHSKYGVLKVGRKILPELSVASVGLAFKSVSGGNTFLYLLNGSSDLSAYECRVGLFSNRIDVYDSSLALIYSHTIELTDFVYVDFLLNVYDQTFKLYINEELVLHLLNFTCGSFTEFAFLGVNSSGHTDLLTSLFDDLYVADDRLGDIAIIANSPVSDISFSGFVPSVGTTVYETVDERPGDETDYSQSANVGDKTSMGMTVSFGDVIGDILDNDLFVLASVPDGGIGSGVLPGIITSNGESIGAEMNGTNLTPKYLISNWLINPDTGVQFTRSELESLVGISLEISS